MSTTTHQGAEGAETMTADLIERLTAWSRNDPDPVYFFEGDAAPFSAMQDDCAEAADRLRTLSTPAPRTDGGMTAGALDELTESEVAGRAKKLLTDHGWQPGQNLHFPAVIGLMTKLGIGLLKDPPQDRCAHPACGCDADSVCGSVSAAPAGWAGAVSDGLRALSEAASALLSACMTDMGPLDEMDRDDEPVGMSGFGVGTAVTFGHLRRMERALASHPAGQSAGSGERIAEIVNRWHDWIVSASADMDQPEWSSGSRQTMEDDRDFLLRALPAQKSAPDSTRTDQGEATYTQAEYDESHEIGRRDGYQEGVQDAAVRAGLDGEYRVSPDPERNVPDPDTMLDRIAERVEALAARPTAPEAQGAWLRKAADEIDKIADLWSGDGRSYAKTIAAMFRVEADRQEHAPPSSSGQEG